MKKMLKRIAGETYYYREGKKIIGVHEDISGDVSGISGDVSYISGNVSYISGNVSGIRGNVSGIRGNVSGIRGNVDLCEISEEERKVGIKIEELLSEN